MFVFAVYVVPCSLDTAVRRGLLLCGGDVGDGDPGLNADDVE